MRGEDSAHGDEKFEGEFLLFEGNPASRVDAQGPRRCSEFFNLKWPRDIDFFLGGGVGNAWFICLFHNDLKKSYIC